MPRHQLSIVHQAGPSTAIVQQPTAKLTLVRRSAIKSTIQRVTPTQDEIEEERDELVDLARMPRSFPTAEQGVPTPGKTNVHEPSRSVPQAPLTVVQPVAAEDDVDVLILDSAPPGFSTLQRIGRLEGVLSSVTNELAQLKGKVFQEKRTAEQAKMAPLLVLMVMSKAVTRATFGRYNEARKRCGHGPWPPSTQLGECWR